MKRRVIALALAAAIALTAGAASAGIVNSDVHAYGKSFCGSGWDWEVVSPRMIAHAGGACIRVPSEGRAAFTVTTDSAGTFPNIGNGYQLGADSCPSKADLKGGLCGLYPVRLGREGEPRVTVKAVMPGGYQGNVATDVWYSPSPARTSFADRCSKNLADSYVEIMAWIAHPRDYPGTPGEYTTWLDGRKWRVMTWETHTGCPAGEGWRLLIFEAPQVTDGSVSIHGLKLNVFSGWAIAHGMMTPRWWLTAVDLGFEIHANGAGLAVQGYSLTGGTR